jgi:ribokinase
MSRPIVVVGSLNTDLVVRAERFPAPGETVTGQGFAVYPGGKGANQAVAAARLGGRVSMLGRVGADDHGRLLRTSLRTAGADDAAVRDDEAEPTGVAVITIDASGQNSIVLAPGANGRLRPSDVESRRDIVENAAVLLLQLEVPLDTVEAAARLARNAGVTVILDPAPARTEALGLLPMVDVLTPNETELRVLAGADSDAKATREAPDLARALLARGCVTVVAKLGEAGAVGVAADAEWTWPARRVTAVDTTAAGDAWNGAFAVALAEGRSIADAGLFATAAATVSVTRKGAQPGMPTRREVESFLADKEKGR